ncbi:MAG: hypothetical protein EPO58_10050 [Chitinophagaceae bacterium]|nr:MAG: hypothetical protein EPO58_10050 [Chitinophagaceae bacterium]
MHLTQRLLIIAVLSFLLTESQARYTDSLPRHRKNIFTLAFYKQPGKDSMVDFVDGIYRVFKPGKTRTYNGTAESKHFTFVPAVEYSLVTRLAVSLNASLVVPGKRKTDNNSTLSGELKYTQNKQIIGQLVSNLWLKNNRYILNTNWSYARFPQKDFGLGANSELNRFNLLDYHYLKLHQSILKRLAPDLYAGPGLAIDHHWNITDTTTLNKPLTGFNQYGFTNASTSIGISVNLLYDTRKNLANPVPNSSYVNLIYRNNLTALGSNQHWQGLVIDARKYFAFPKASKNILAFWTYNLLTLRGKPPYLHLPATASDVYNNTGRGYIQGRFRGDKLLFAESEYRFGITENGFLGAVIFANMQSVSEQAGKNIQGLKTGYGAGIRIKLNKHSNTNIALDYGFGQGGSRGLFMNLGEVF